MTGPSEALPATPSPPPAQPRRASRRPTRRAFRNPLVLGLGVLLVVLFALLGTALAYVSPGRSGTTIGLSQLQDLGDSRGVTRATFLDQDSQVVAVTTDGRTVRAAYPSTGALTSQLDTALRSGGAVVTVDQQAGVGRVRFVAQFVLPVLLLANLFAMLLTLTRRDDSVTDIAAFGSLTGGRVPGGSVGFADVGGAGEAVAELAEVVDYLKDPARYRAVGAAPPKGVLLFGAPGTGKTLLAKAVAGEAGVPFFSVAGAQFVESLVGVGAARVRDLFARVRAVAPAIVFIDELDAVGRLRGASATGGSDERENTLNQLLVEMDGFDVSSGIVVIAATNRPDILDPALTRPGRFDRHVTVERPDVAGRRQILAVHTRTKPLGPDVDLDEVARRTPGFTGADLANVVNEAALLSVRAGVATISHRTLLTAIDRALHGTQRRARVLDADELRRIALHEAGHAVVAASLGRSRDVQRISVLPRGRSLGTTTMSSDEGVRSTAQLRVALAVHVAGRVSEQVSLTDVSSASENDLEVATELARDMVTRFGMSTLGAARLAPTTAATVLGTGAPVSPATLQAVDAEVARLIAEAEADAAAAIRANEALLTELADLLMTQETVEGLMLAQLLDKAGAATGARRPLVRSGR